MEEQKEEGLKRRVPDEEDEGSDSDSSEDFGPKPLASTTEAQQETEPNRNEVEVTEQKKKKRKKKVLQFEKVYLEKLPSAERYEKSYMHRDVVTHVVVSAPTDFIVTGSADGHIKFWKKLPEEVEFVKHYHAHLGTLLALALGSAGRRLATTGGDGAVKLYDVAAFDMTEMAQAPPAGQEGHWAPGAAAWVHAPEEPRGRLAVADGKSGAVRIYPGEGIREDAPLHVLACHAAPVTALAYNAAAGVGVSADQKGMIEYWDCAPGEGYGMPTRKVAFQYKLETDLYDLAKAKTQCTAMAFSRDGRRLALAARDRRVRVLDFARGKLQRVYDEGPRVYDAASRAGRLGLDALNYGRRSAVEQELAESQEATALANLAFDDSGHFLLYAALTGVKVVNLETDRVARTLGRREGERFLAVALYQGVPKVDSQMMMARQKGKAAKMAEELAKGPEEDPCLFATAFKKRRFYIFSSREPTETVGGGEDGDDTGRDVFNEKPTAEEQVAVFAESKKALGQEAVLRTTLGDVHLKLYHQECPRTVENFSEHGRGGYYDGLIFHRVIKGFMIQTGDPLGDGTGGESIWGGEFEDEFHRSLRHDRPFTVSMANAGPNTNGSQFFITTVPCPWLDQKHTVFGRVTKGMETCQAIENAKVDRFDKPYEDIKIINVEII